MSIFSKFKNNDVSIEETVEKVSSGTKFGPVETGIYKVVIKKAYLDESAKGAMNFNMEFLTESGNLIRIKEYFTKNKENGQVNYYTKDGKNHLFPSYILLQDIAALAAQVRLEDMETEAGKVMIFDYTQGKEVPQSKEILTELLGKKINLAIEKQIEDKTANDGNGNYLPTGETREVNKVVKAFCPDDRTTVTEKKAHEEGAYAERWLENNEGKTIDKSVGVKQTTASRPSAAKTESAPKPTTSLFG